MNTQTILEKYTPEKSNLLHILHECQRESGQHYISKDTIKEIAAYLNVPLSSVYGVITYYSLLSVEPRGKYIIRVCDSPICNAQGAESLLTTVKELLGIGVDETTGDNLFTLEVSECLGRCAQAPSVMINDTVYGNLDRKKLETIIEKHKQQ
jgi:NADH:ubiquinone oxidoreductase subunit E